MIIRIDKETSRLEEILAGPTEQPLHLTMDWYLSKPLKISAEHSVSVRRERDADYKVLIEAYETFKSGFYGPVQPSAIKFRMDQICSRILQRNTLGNQKEKPIDGHQVLDEFELCEIALWLYLDKLYRSEGLPGATVSPDKLTNLATKAYTIFERDHPNLLSKSQSYLDVEERIIGTGSGIFSGAAMSFLFIEGNIIAAKELSIGGLASVLGIGAVGLLGLEYVFSKITKEQVKTSEWLTLYTPLNLGMGFLATGGFYADNVLNKPWFGKFTDDIMNSVYAWKNGTASILGACQGAIQSFDPFVLCGAVVGGAIGACISKSKPHPYPKLREIYRLFAPEKVGGTYKFLSLDELEKRLEDQQLGVRE